MGADLRREDMDVEAWHSDYTAFRCVERVLQSVKMDRNLVDPSDQKEYDNLISILDQSKRKSIDEEAMLVTTLKALSEAVSKIDIMYHHSLLNNIFSISIWYLQRHTMDAFLDLITRLAAVADQYLRECLQMLVNNFTPPGHLIFQGKLPGWAVSRKKYIHFGLCESLKTISDTVPLAPRMLRDIIDRSMPKLFDDKAKMVSFVECMLGLDTDRMGDLMGAVLLAKVVELLTELDVHITWEDILQEEHNIGIFDMELEDLDGDEDVLRQAGTKVLFGGNICADKLDGLMVVVCEHLTLCAERGYLPKEFDILMTIFRASVLRVHRSKFAQFIMFYACSLDPKTCGPQFAVFLTEILLKKEEDPISRMSAVSYLGSYLSRARFISANTVVAVLQRLVDWCVSYCDHQKSRGTAPNPNHQVFYATCQAVMYVLCFRLRSIMDYKNLTKELKNMPFGFLLTHPLEPLKVCLPSIVNEFLRQAKDAKLFTAFRDSTLDDAIESDLSRTFGGIGRLDMFFPFDPYLLKESDRYMRPNFEFWSMVKTTYSVDNEDADHELEDLDAGMNVGSLDDRVDIVINNGDDSENDDHDERDIKNDDGLENSMNNMSITPYDSYLHSLAEKSGVGLSMPARIRPSVSPPS